MNMIKSCYILINWNLLAVGDHLGEILKKIRNDKLEKRIEFYDLIQNDEANNYKLASTEYFIQPFSYI